MKRLVIAAVVAAIGLVAPGRAGAQETVNYGSVGGRVTDQTGAVVGHAQVSARQTETGVVVSTTTDATGRFRLPYLQVGPYDVAVTQSGFRDAVRQVTVTVGAAFELPITLTVASLDVGVTVTSAAPVVEAARTQIAATLAPAEIRALPLNGRNVLDLALLVPGVSPTNVGGGTQLFPETSAVPGVGISVGSQRNLSNSFIVDGLSANDDAAALSGMPYGVDAIDQFQVVTSGGQAELGRALGGYVNIVTKSGTNTAQGTAYTFIRDDALNAANPLLLAQNPSHATLPMHQNQFGGSLGGPIVRNRMFYFVNAEQRRLEQSGLTTIKDADAATIDARLAAVGYSGAGVTTGVYADPVTSTNVMGKLDDQIGQRHHTSVRYSLYDVHALNARGAGALSAPSASAGLDDRDQTIAFSDVVALSSRLVNETRAQIARSNLLAPPSDPIGPAVSIAGVGAFGTLSGSPTARLSTTYEVTDSLSYQAGAHAVRAGVDVLDNDVTITYPRSIRGAYTFSSLSNFLAGAYSNSGFTQTFGASAVALTNPNLGLYLQDEWKIGSRLTVNGGLRYDLQYLETITTDRNNVSPRLGLAWVPDDARRTVIRASAGIFYDRVPLRALANALLSADNTTDLANLQQIGVSLSPAQTGAPLFPNILDQAVPAVTLVNFSTMDRQLQNASSDQVSAEIERQIGATATVNIGYEHLRGRNLLMSINQNVPTCVAAGSNNGCRPNATYANNSQYSGAGASESNALHLSIVQRPTRWGSYRVSYAYSTSMNNVGEAFFSSPIDPTDLSKDWGRSDDDQRHRLVVSGSISAPDMAGASLWARVTHGFRASVMLQAYSALPYNITSGVTTIQGTAGRPMVEGTFIARNAGQGTPFFSLNVRLSRVVPLAGRASVELLAEAFNLTNHTNNLAFNGNFGAGVYPSNPSSTFGQVTAVGDPRSVQLGARLQF